MGVWSVSVSVELCDDVEVCRWRGLKKCGVAE